MSKIPPMLLQKLAQLRRRERLLRFVWGFARLLSVVVLVFLVCCFVDWLVDLWDDTPWRLRQWMSYGQLAIAGLVCLALVVWPQLRRYRNEKLALQVEEKRSELQHRLISALQLNRPDAPTAGMSEEMLAAMTREAEEKSRKISFSAIADHRRLKHSLFLIAPVILLALGLYLLDPATASVLIERQMLADIDIPRSVTIAAAGRTIWPAGEDVQLTFTVVGPGLKPGRIGTVRVRAGDDDEFTVPLEFQSAVGEGVATFVATVPPSSADFSYKAKVGDGRIRVPGQVHFVARPSIVKQDAYVVLPEYVGLRADGSRYEQAHLRGDIVGMNGLPVRIAIQTQKPIVRAVLETDGSPYPDLSGPTGLTRTQELRGRSLAILSAALNQPTPLGAVGSLSTANVALEAVPLRRFEQTFEPATQSAEWRFDLKATETSYRIVVFDEYGFRSKTESVRSIKIEPEPPPMVVLHAERWDPPPAFKSKSKSPPLLDFEGMPLPLVDDDKPGKVRISYEAFGPYGLGEAKLKIGVIRGSNDSEGDGKNPKLERWVELPLFEVAPTERTFNKSTGAFADTPDDEDVPFYPLPSTDPDKVWPRKFAGGRYDYKPAGFYDPESKEPFVFKPDDKLVVYVEVYNRNPDPAKRLMGKSRIREKDIVSWERFEAWCYDTLQEASRIESLMQMQQRVYERGGSSLSVPK